MLTMNTTKNTTAQSRTSTYKPPRDEAEAQRRREYARAYRAANRDKVKRWNRTYYLRQAAKALGANAAIFSAAGEGEAK